MRCFFLLVILFCMRGVVMAQDAADVVTMEEDLSRAYDIVSTDYDQLPSNFSFVIPEDITMVETEELDSINKPAYTLYYPHTRDEFEINIYVVQFDVTVFATAVPEIYQILRGYKNDEIALKRDENGKVIPSKETSSTNRIFIRADTSDSSEQTIHGIYSFENMVVIIDAHVQKEHYKKYREEIITLIQEFKFLKPLILENHVEEFKNSTLSYLYPKGWKPSVFGNAVTDTGAVDGIRPWGMELHLHDYDIGFPYIQVYSYDLPFHAWERVKNRWSIVDFFESNENNKGNIILLNTYIKRERFFYDGKVNGDIAAWEFVYSWIKMNSSFSFTRLKETGKIAVFLYEVIDPEINQQKNEEAFRLSCIGESAEGLIFSTLTDAYEPYFADAFYLE